MLLVSLENVTSVYFIFHIIQTSVVTVSNNSLTHLFKLC